MINWKLRLKNKTTLMSLALTTIAFIYNILGAFEIVPAISQDSIVQLVTLIINFLAVLGIIVDPTTAGLSDSNKAMEYKEPRKDETK